MTDLNKKTNELIFELYKNFIFYLPKQIITQLFSEGNIKESEYDLLQPFLNDVSYINEDDWVINKISPFDKTVLSLKSSKLLKSVYTLFELKESLQPDTFSFIFEKYYEQLNFHKTVATLIVDNYEPHCNEKSEDLQAIFLLQQEIINKHFNEVQKHFTKNIFNTKKIDTSKFLKNILSSKNTFTPKIKLRNYLLDQNSIEIENIIVELYLNRSGSNFRYLIEAMEEIKLITLEYGKKKLIYEAMSNSFNTKIPSYKSIFGYSIEKVNNPDYKNVKLELNKSLNKYIN